MDTVIKIKNLHKQYKMGKDNFVKALDGIDLEIKKGEMVAVIGPSGSGKSTLMHMMGCLDKPDEGEIWINDQKVSSLKSKALTKIRSKEIGFVFQTFNLITTLTAQENVALAAEYFGKSARESMEIALTSLDKVNMKNRARHKPSELSGGQRQRVAVARSLINNPSFILADEPTGNLDTKSSEHVIELLQKLNKDQQTTVIIVTHNPEIAQQCGRTITIRDGKIVK